MVHISERIKIANNASIHTLEKIKAEIKEKAYSNVFISDSENFYELRYKIVDLNDINKIIDDCIFELKGEQE